MRLGLEDLEREELEEAERVLLRVMGWQTTHGRMGPSDGELAELLRLPPERVRELRDVALEHELVVGHWVPTTKGLRAVRGQCPAGVVVVPWT